jgi:hypothetical protein
MLVNWGFHEGFHLRIRPELGLFRPFTSRRTMVHPRIS